MRHLFEKVLTDYMGEASACLLTDALFDFYMTAEQSDLDEANEAVGRLEMADIMTTLVEARMEPAEAIEVLEDISPYEVLGVVAAACGCRHLQLPELSATDSEFCVGDILAPVSVKNAAPGKWLVGFFDDAVCIHTEEISIEMLEDAEEEDFEVSVRDGIVGIWVMPKDDIDVEAIRQSVGFFGSHVSEDGIVIARQNVGGRRLKVLVQRDDDGLARRVFLELVENSY